MNYSFIGFKVPEYSYKQSECYIDEKSQNECDQYMPFVCFLTLPNNSIIFVKVHEEIYFKNTQFNIIDIFLLFVIQQWAVNKKSNICLLSAAYNNI